MRNDGITGLKGRTTQTSQPTGQRATEKNRANMSGPTGPGPPRRQKDAGNTNPMACQVCRDTETSTNRAKGPPIKRRDLGKQGRGPTGPLESAGHNGLPSYSGSKKHGKPTEPTTKDSSHTAYKDPKDEGWEQRQTMATRSQGLPSTTKQ